MPVDRIAVIAKLLTDIAAKPTADVPALTATLAEHYPRLTVEEVRVALDRALAAQCGNHG